MTFIGKLAGNLQAAAQKFTLEALAKDLQPQIDAALIKNGKASQRKSKLSPKLMTWFNLALGLRRDLGYDNLLDWLVSGLRSREWHIPRKPVEDGALSHARKRMGIEVSREIFEASKSPLTPDFHGFSSVAIDGTGLTMPDTPQNRECFGKPGTNRRDTRISADTACGTCRRSNASPLRCCLRTVSWEKEQANWLWERSSL